MNALDHVVAASAGELAAAIRARRLSSVEVVEAHLRRIDEVNPRINAIVQLAGDAARAQARAADKMLFHDRVTGPLHGVPFTAKDVCDAAGVISAAGLRNRAAFVPERDAVVVSRMKSAGAILLGKTNCPPGGGGGETDNRVYGRTRNPYDLSRTVGGSSGGEAAAIAACMSPIGIGSDSGGSVRVPAHFCGIAALKPTSGRVPATGTLNHPGGLSDYRTQIGPMARHVDDLALAFAIMAGEDGHDSAVIPMPIRDPASVTLRELRIASYTDDGLARPTPEIEASLREAADALRDGGAGVEEDARPACLGDSRPITERYWRFAGRQEVDVERLLADWDAFRSAMLAFMAPFDAILCPVDYRAATPPDEPAPLRFNYTLPFSLSGWPCVVVRTGTSHGGMPIGVQIVARSFREDVALAVARHLEATMGGWQAPAEVDELQG
ncbi:MAG TPA: amidase [Candidatus Dormibacteraeota bacterium]|nr:amidase [Candidatus Dormibacteraeota bacterium]